MYPAENRTHPRPLLHPGNASIEVINSQDDVIKTCLHGTSYLIVQALHLSF
jgi:hypothetical protein